jgi:hypothetical protein
VWLRADCSINKHLKRTRGWVGFSLRDRRGVQNHDLGSRDNSECGLLRGGGFSSGRLRMLVHGTSMANSSDSTGAGNSASRPTSTST